MNTGAHNASSFLLFILMTIIQFTNVPAGEGMIAPREKTPFSLSTAQRMDKAEYPGEKSIWKGFLRYDFAFRVEDDTELIHDDQGIHVQGIPAHIVLPKKALPGRPWIWRARFPDWHTEMDSILLSRGFHLAYINTDNRFGSPNAMMIWDAFYQYLITAFEWSQKVSLEGVSRGGLFIYGWAKRNPEKINCIYAEAPVCDFKSWPGGFGTGEGHKASWEILKKEYGFKSDDEAKQWDDNPLDNLEELAGAKVPILHMIGLQDKVVPPDENTFKLFNLYTKLGGPATIIPCTRGLQSLEGHHFPIETPELAADFILYHTPVPRGETDLFEPPSQ
jgi:pimeloyl-ACP methyl ester carboxylesterase